MFVFFSIQCLVDCWIRKFIIICVETCRKLYQCTRDVVERSYIVCNSSYNKGQRRVSRRSKSRSIANNSKIVGINDLHDFEKEKQYLIDLEIKFENELSILKTRKLAAEKTISQTEKKRKDAKKEFKSHKRAYKSNKLEKQQQLNQCCKQITILENQLKIEQEKKMTLQVEMQQHEAIFQQQKNDNTRKMNDYANQIEEQEQSIEKCKEWIEVKYKNDDGGSDDKDDDKDNDDDESPVARFKQKINAINKSLDDKYLELIKDWKNWDLSNARYFVLNAIKNELKLNSKNNHEIDNHPYIVSVKRKFNLVGRDLLNVSESTLKVLGINKEEDRKKILMFIKSVVLFDIDIDDDDDDDDESDSDIFTFANDNSNNNNGRSSRNKNSKEKEKDKRKEKEDKIQQGYTCLMCMEGNVTMMYTQCGHLCLCQECYNNWKKEKNYCPRCRKSGAARKVFASGC